MGHLIILEELYHILIVSLGTNGDVHYNEGLAETIAQLLMKLGTVAHGGFIRKQEKERRRRVEKDRT